MQKNNLYKIIVGAALVLSSTWFGCTKDKLDLPDQPVEIYSQVYMPEAVNGSVFTTLKITDSLQTVVYGANFGGQGYPDNDIALKFMVDSAKIDSFNLANGTIYELLPSSSYQLASLSATIPKGKTSTMPLEISIKTTGAGAMDVLKTYLLPVSIATSSVKVNENLRTTFYLIKSQPEFKDYPDYARSSWRIIDFSSEEANGEGPDNGRAIFALDGNDETFWHSQWQGNTAAPPHHLTIDMGSVKTLHGLSFLGRQGGYDGKPENVQIEVSTDSLSWVQAGSFTLQNSTDLQPQFLSNGFKEARYFKVIINSAYNSIVTQIAELNAF